MNGYYEWEWLEFLMIDHFTNTTATATNGFKIRNERGFAASLHPKIWIPRRHGIPNKNHPAIIQRATRPGKHTKNYGKSPFLMGKSTINGNFQ